MNETTTNDDHTLCNIPALLSETDESDETRPSMLET